MTKKSASQFKIAEKKAELPPIEDVFQTQKDGMLKTIEMQIKQDSRFDTMLAMRETYRRFFDKDTMTIAYAKELSGKVRKLHETIKAKIEAFTLEDAIAEDFVNPCDELVAFDDPEDWITVFEQSVTFSAVQPYGEGFDTFHGRMMDEVSKRA